MALALLLRVVGALVVIASPSIGAFGRPRLLASSDDAPNATSQDAGAAFAFAASLAEAVPATDAVAPCPPDAPRSFDSGGPSLGGDG